jgi:hypothetical protein
METIIKKITLNDFKNFDPNVTIKCLDDETDGCWGKIPMDLIVEDRALIGELPLVETMVNDNGTVFYALVLRYYNIKKLQVLRENYNSSMEYYILADIKGKKKWIKSNKQLNSVEMFSTLPPVYGYECGKRIGVNIYHEEYSQYSSKTWDIIEKYFAMDSSLKYTPPYMNMPLFISSNITDGGSLMSDLQKWTSNKEYIHGDVVFYEGEYYVANSKHLDKYFDAKKWTKLNFNAPLATDVSKNSYYTESKLSNFLPARKTYDDNGILLPFIFKEDKIYLQYKVGYTNHIRTNDTLFVDYLESIKIGNNVYDDEGEIEITPQLTGATSIKFTYIIDAKVEGLNIVKDTGIRYSEVRNCRYVTETFTIDRKPVECGYLKIDSLTVYSKTNNLSVPYAQILNLSINDRFMTLEQGKTYNQNDVIFDYLTNSYYRYNNNKWEILNFSHIFVNDKLLGTSYVDVDLPKITIDRGNYAAMERHYVLGEINSFDDLEKYRNNLFKL